MSDDPNLQDRLLELYFGVLPEEEAEALLAAIERDTALAEAYAVVQADAGLMGEAARLQTPPIALNRPEPNGRGSGLASVAPTASTPELTPWSRWSQWGLVTAASLLILVSLVGWAQRRSQVAGAGADRLRLQVTGPSQVLESADNRYSIATTTITGHPISTNVHFAVYSAGGTRLLGHTERTDDNGTLQVDIPADLQLPDSVRIEIKAGGESSSQLAESRLPVRREPLSTYVRLDRSVYAPGESGHYRTVTLSRFHLDPKGELPVQFVIQGPDGTEMDGTRRQAIAERGVAVGDFVIPIDAPGGVYTLLVSSPKAAFFDVRRRFLVHESYGTELQKDLEFAGVGYGPGVEVNAAFRATRRDGTPASHAAVQVAVLVGDEKVYEDSAVTDDNGALAICFRLPEQIDSSEAMLALTVDDGSIRETLQEPIPMGQGKIIVEFFPEGGDLAAVGENRVYFTARDSAGDPVTLTGWIVDENGNYSARVETVHQGRGMFRLSPRVGVRYRLILESPVDTKVDGRLPFVMPTQKVVLNTGKGVFEPREPVEFNVRASQPGIPLVAMASCRGVHVGEQAFLTKSSVNGNGKAVANAVAIALPDTVAGVIRLTIFDYSVTPPRPVAERLVYRRPLEELHVAFEADRKVYAPGDTCQLGVSVSDERGRPLESLLGVSVVDEAALESEQCAPRTMSSFFWLTSEITHPQDLEDASFLLENTPEAEVALDLLLGTQGWRRFTERSGEPSRGGPAAAKQSRQLVALGADSSPPLMLDNLSDLLARSDATRKRDVSGSPKEGRLLAALIVLGGAGMLVLVTMMSLLKIGSGVRLWAPPTIAVGVSFFLVFLTIRPDPLTARTVAFLSYRPPESVEVRDTSDGAREALGILPSAESQTHEERKGGTESEAETESVAVVENSKEEPGLPAEVVATPADKPVPDRSKGEEPADSKQNEKGRKVGTPVHAAARAEPLGGSIEDTPMAEIAEPESVPMPEASPNRIERGRLRQETPVLKKHDATAVTSDSLLLREYRFDSVRSMAAVRTGFAKTVLWSPMLATDAKGHALLSFDLSDSVTRFRAVADAHGAGRIGSAVDTIVSKLPFHLSATVPAEVSRGDRIDMPLIVTDERSQAGEVCLSVETTDGLGNIGDAEHVLEMDSGDRGRHVFSVEATGLSDEAVVRFRGQAGEDVDAIERIVRIKSAGYPQADVVSGVVKGDKELNVVVPEDALPGSVRVTLTFFPSLASDLELELRSIRGSGLDATLTALVCADLLIDDLKRTSSVDPVSLRQAKERRAEALLRLGRFCDSAGGYSRVEGGTADPLATAQVVLALVKDQDVFDRASTQIRPTVQWLADCLGNRSDMKDATARAWGLWALAEAGQADLTPELEEIATQALKRKDVQGMALAALAAHRLNHNLAGKLLNGLAEQQADDGRVAANGVSDTEMTALAALAWLTQAVDSKSTTNAVSWLLSARGELGDFGSSRGTALALRALARHERIRPRVEGGTRISSYLDGELLSERDFPTNLGQAIVLEDFSASLKSGEHSLRLVLTDGTELPFTLAVHSFCKARPAASGNGPLRLETHLAQSEIEEGQTVRLTVRLENTGELELNSAVAEIGLPAGLNVAPSLLDAQKKAGHISAYETLPRRLILFWDALAPAESVKLTLDATASVPGHFSGPPSSAYLSQDSLVRYWTEPLVMEIRAKQ